MRLNYATLWLLQLLLQQLHDASRNAAAFLRRMIRYTCLRRSTASPLRHALLSLGFLLYFMLHESFLFSTSS